MKVKSRVEKKVLEGKNGGRAHYIIESNVQWKPFWLATQQYPQNDWLGGKFPYTMTYAHGPHWKTRNVLCCWSLIKIAITIRCHWYGFICTPFPVHFYHFFVYFTMFESMPLGLVMWDQPIFSDLDLRFHISYFVIISLSSSSPLSPRISKSNFSTSLSQHHAQSATVSPRNNVQLPKVED